VQQQLTWPRCNILTCSKHHLKILALDPFKICPVSMFSDIWFYDSFLDETTKNIDTGDITTIPKYPRKMDEVIDAMDLIVVVWRLAPITRRFVLACVRLQNFAGVIMNVPVRTGTKLVYSIISDVSVSAVTDSRRDFWTQIRR
jgi:hypothetical protein